MTPTELKKIRQALGITAKELAGCLGITTKAVNNWEQGRRKIKGPALKMIEEMKISSFEETK